MKGLAVVVLRFTRPGERQFRVPINLKIGNTEIPLGLCLITLTLFALCIINLFTKQVATLSGVVFTIVFFGIFSASERATRKRGAAHTELDQFNLEAAAGLTPQALGVRPGNALVMVRDYNSLYHLPGLLERVHPSEQDVVVLHLRLLTRASSGEHELKAEQLFSFKEQELFTRALALAEAQGKTVHLGVAPATEKWDGILRGAQSLQSSKILLGLSSWRPAPEEARIAGLAWEQLPDPKPHLTLEIHSPAGQAQVYYLGPHAPLLTPREISLLHSVWLELSGVVAPEELHHHDVVHFALEELRGELHDMRREDILARLRSHLRKIRRRPSSRL
jgi:hypothetical protein